MADDDEEEGKKKEQGGDPAWMLTFADLVSLMLTFFVLLFSMSSVKTAKWEQMVQALTRRLNPTQQAQVSASSARHNIPKTFRPQAVNLKYFSALLEEKREDDPVLERSVQTLSDGALRLSMPADLLFEQGSARLTDRAEQALYVLAGVLDGVGNQVTVRGHTDGSPVRDERYTSNWELSLARATAVANGLHGAGYSMPVTAYGLAATREGLLPADLPPAQRRRLSRRVDVVVLSEAAGGG